jgi:hypothetical protein
LKELQDINRTHVHKALEAKSGKIQPKFVGNRKKDEPKEWRSWTSEYISLIAGFLFVHTSPLEASQFKHLIQNSVHRELTNL